MGRLFDWDRAVSIGVRNLYIGSMALLLRGIKLLVALKCAQAKLICTDIPLEELEIT